LAFRKNGKPVNITIEPDGLTNNHARSHDSLSGKRMRTWTWVLALAVCVMSAVAQGERKSLDRQIESERRLARELDRYRGEWVAIHSHTVIGHAATPEELERQLASGDQPEPDRTFRVTVGDGATLL
jgi:hypothetical protein